MRHVMTTAASVLGAVALITGVATAQTETGETTPGVRTPKLHLAPEVGGNTVYVVFRTDAPIARRESGGYEGRVVVAGKTASLSRARGASRCYAAFVKGSLRDGEPKVRFRHGRRYRVAVFTGRDTEPAWTGRLRLTNAPERHDGGRRPRC